MSENKIIIAGGSGFIGQALARYYAGKDWKVVILSRRPGASSGNQPQKAAQAGQIMELPWNAATPGPWAMALENAALMVNLTGKGISCRHTPENRKTILESRVNSVAAITAAINRTRQPPAVWVQASAIGFYGNSGDDVCTEETAAGTDFLAETCAAWENALHAAATPATRRIIVRIGLVLGSHGGLLEPLAKITRLGLGGTVGSGQQWMSWIHLADIVGIIEWLAQERMAQGIFNATAPNPMRNKDFMAALRKALHRPWSPPAPAFAVRLGSRLMGTQGDLALAGCRAIPQRLLQAGFSFSFVTLPSALRDCVGK